MDSQNTQAGDHNYGGSNNQANNLSVQQYQSLRFEGLPPPSNKKDPAPPGASHYRPPSPKNIPQYNIPRNDSAATGKPYLAHFAKYIATLEKFCSPRATEIADQIDTNILLLQGESMMKEFDKHCAEKIRGAQSRLLGLMEEAASYEGCVIPVQAYYDTLNYLSMEDLAIEEKP
ncbi:hypothetical protein EJ05DRAFT_483216 [Pseudovirgaria hyperparasitica]|uniref:Uncharacterized protein n=1 Tax=Pseudovirgaria hyperparasitica TaxID=470096 RepID=A0A6A6WFE8_9PEZI|nr:uncharacterized protein EJ05DRAFT_483216 [Pseudovirgaria hyperparasitica]KAF2760764.1 hypothetical protein EJ05DRAFT_483216 [Pseudovirgaria hyperparasitica]